MLFRSNRPTIAPWAIRALGDAQTWETHEATDVFKRGLQSEESRTLLETLVALDKLGTNARSKTEGTTQVRSQDESIDWSVRIAPHLSSPDATIRHLATRAIARLGAIDKCIAICSEQSETSLAFEHAVQALSLIHDPERVNQLINALDRVPAQVRTQKESSFGNAMARALARLYMHEGEWTGTSWGTRPDTRGPYYQPEKWDASAAIEEAMNRWLKKQDGGSATETLRLLSLNRWDISSKIGDWIRSPQWNEIPFQQRITLMESAGNLSDDALGLLDRVAEDPRLSEEDLLGLFKVSLQQSSPSSLSVVRKVLKRIGSLSTEALATAWKRCHESDRLAKQLSVLSESASKDTDLGSAILVSAVASRKDQAKRAESTDAIDRWWGSTSVVVELLNMLRVGKCKQAEGIVQRAMLDNRSEVEKLGREIATEWGLGDLNQWTGPKISTLDKSEVLKQVVGTKGDVKRGEQAFGLLGCAKCHDVKPSESLRGPYLPNVAKTYRRDQLTEAILMPSKSIAQGFVQNVFRLDDDSVVSGFVTKESAQKILIRNAQGEVVEIEVESITERKESPLSVMPEGLVDGVPVPALVDLVSYLESLN